MYKANGPLELGPKASSATSKPTAACMAVRTRRCISTPLPTTPASPGASRLPPANWSSAAWARTCRQPISTSDVRIGDIWRLGTARLQLCQPRNPCWKIDERYGCEGMAEFIAEQRLTGWYWRVVTPGTVAPAMRWNLASDPGLHAGRGHAALAGAPPATGGSGKAGSQPGIADHWRQKIATRIDWLRKNTGQTPPPVVAFHVKPENP
jgi:hypothetical protein